MHGPSSTFGVLSFASYVQLGLVEKDVLTSSSVTFLYATLPSLLPSQVFLRCRSGVGT